MKMKRRKGGLRDPHFVPLSRQAVEIIRQLEPLTGKGQYLFPSARSFKRPMSENTLNAALRRLGYDNEEMTAHGFRSMASTRLNESGKWSGDAIELQLAHEDSDQTRKSYMAKARFREERVKMMQWWADYLDTLHDGGAEVVPLTKESDHGR